MILRLLFAALVCWGLSVLGGCAVVPRLPLDVQRAVNRDTMRVLHTQSVDLYYPEHRKQQAYALAERAEGCIEPLRRASIGRGGITDRRLELIYADLPYNNAFVNPPSNGDFFSVLASHWTMDIVAETGMPPDAGYIACHELTHYIQAQQTMRSLGLVDRLFGYVVTPQAGLDGWFWEGLATYYEEALQPHTGRPAWPAWDGLFRAAIADKRLDGGDLSELNRKLHWGNHYVYGSHFIGYLIQTYGEARLWKLIERQGEAFFFPFIVNQRFNQVYGKRLSQLIDEFREAMRAKYPPRVRPATQHTLRALGMNGRYARAADGSEAVVSDAMDAPAALTVYAADGSVRYRELLTDVLPRRNLVSPESRVVSGLRFSRDSQHLYFVAVDPDLVFQETRLMHLDLTTRDLTRVSANLGGLGGDISPDGRHYLFVRADAQGHALATYDLRTGEVRELHRPPPGVYFSSPNYSPDGSRLAVSVFAGGYALALFDARTGERLRTLSPTQGPLYDVSFIDDERLLFLGEHEGRFQAFSYALSTRQLTRLTDAPYLVLQPRAANGTVRFLNREGLSYTLDEVTIPSSGVAAIGGLTSAPRFLADVGPDAGGAPAASAPVQTVASPADAGVTAAPVVPAATVPAAAAVAAPAATAPVPAPPAGEPGAGPPGTPPPALPLEFQGVVTSEPASGAPPPSAQAQAPSPAQAAATLGSRASTLSIVEDRWPSLPPPPSLLLTRAEDEPYAVWPRLAIPSVRAPQFFSSAGAFYLGAYLGGTDALGKHRWGGSVGVQPGGPRWSGSFAYLNAQLSPVLIELAGSQVAFDARRSEYGDPDGDGKNENYVENNDTRQRDLSLAARLVLRTSELGLALHVTNDQQQNHDLDKYDSDPLLQAQLAEIYENRTMGGGTLAFAHEAVESTPMSGARRGYATRLSGSYYPSSLSTLSSDVADLRGELRLFSPLPFSRRHTLSLGLRLRGILSDEPAPLLELGGASWLTLYDYPAGQSQDPYVGLAPKRRFQESLRGFEASHFSVEQVGIFDLTYRYPIVIDRGTATSFSIFPAFFLRQIDLELFTTGASDVAKQLREFGHLAVGGSVTVKVVWLVPLALRYQIAQHFSDDRDLQHLIALGLDL